MQTIVSVWGVTNSFRFAWDFPSFRNESPPSPAPAASWIPSVPGKSRTVGDPRGGWGARSTWCAQNILGGTGKEIELLEQSRAPTSYMSRLCGGLGGHREEPRAALCGEVTSGQECTAEWLGLEHSCGRAAVGPVTSPWGWARYSLFWALNLTEQLKEEEDTTKDWAGLSTPQEFPGIMFSPRKRSCHWRTFIVAGSWGNQIGQLSSAKTLGQ